MHYTTITAGELRKMDGAKVRAETDTGKIIEGEITVEGRGIFFLHNNRKAHGVDAKDKKGYKYSWRLNYSRAEDKERAAAINRLETIEEFTEGELVYVSDISVEDAIKDADAHCYLYTTKKGIYVAQQKEEYERATPDDVNGRKYIAKIPKEETVEMTMEEINRALGKKVKIIE